MRLALLSFAMAAPLAAQTAEPRRLCFTAYDSTRCQVYAITEVSAAYPLFSTGEGSTPYFKGTGQHFKPTGQLALGVARNLPDRRSVGIVAIWDGNLRPGFGGVELRMRDWVDTSIVAFEWSVGVGQPEIHFGSDSYRGKGLRGGAAVMIGPYVSMFSRAELVRAGGGPFRSALFGGVGFTSHASYISVLSAATFVGAVLLVMPPT